MSASKWPALVVLLCLTAFAVACGGGSDESSVKDGDVSKVAANFGSAKSFKAKINGGPGTPEAMVEYQQPGSIRVTVNGSAGTQEIVCIDSDFYVKQGSGDWQKVPDGGGSNPGCRANLGAADPRVMGDGLKAATSDPNLAKGAQDKVEGKACQNYTQVMPNASRVEICVADGLPRRIVSRGVGPDQVVTITFTEFNGKVEIKAPI